MQSCHVCHRNSRWAKDGYIDVRQDIFLEFRYHYKSSFPELQQREHAPLFFAVQLFAFKLMKSDSSIVFRRSGAGQPYLGRRPSSLFNVLI